MNNYPKSRKELVADNARLIKNLNRRMKNIENLGFSRNDVGRRAYERYNELKRDLTRQNLLNDSEILTLNRQLNYINELKTSTVAGAKKAQFNFQNIATSLNNLSNNKQQQFWSIYNKLYEENAIVADLFKYESFEFIIDSIYTSKDDDEILNNFITEFNKTYQGFRGDLNNESFKTTLSKRLYDKYIK